MDEETFSTRGAFLFAGSLLIGFASYALFLYLLVIGRGG